MTTQVIPLDPEQFIFASDDQLKTTSLKIAEKFGKRHDNVLRVIDNILTQVSDSFSKLNFEETQTDSLTPTGGVRKDRCFNLTKDGFMIVVMGFTGKEAMTIKEAYINAFNVMYDKLFPRYGQRPLDPPTITKAQQGELFTLASIISGKNGTTRVAVWSRFANHFRISSYKDLPFEKYQEGIDYLERLRLIYGNNVEMIRIPRSEYDALKTAMPLVIDQATELLKLQGYTVGKQGELLEKEKPQDSITITLSGENKRYLVTLCGTVTTLFPVPNDYITGYKDDVVKQLMNEAIEKLKKQGLFIGKKDEVIENLKSIGYVVIEKEMLRWTNIDTINKLIA
jgi:Rha family phage regulatory protein